jgi:hypothetical protein
MFNNVHIIAKMTLTTFLTSCKSSALPQESTQTNQKMSKLSSVRKKLAVLKWSLMTDFAEVSISSIISCRSLTSKAVSVEEPQSVRFGHVEIREYGRILVDHPLCKDGLGLGLDWKYSSKVKKLSLECHETKQKQNGKRENTAIEQLSTYDRKMLLKDIGGYSEKELWEVFCTKLQRDMQTKESRASSS